MKRKLVGLLFGALLVLATAGIASADPPPPCQGQGFHGCSGPGGS